MYAELYKKLSNHFPEWLYHFASKLAIYIIRYVVLSHNGFNLISLMAYDIGHHFLCLFANLISPWIKCLFKSCLYFYNKVFISIWNTFIK